ncbi:MAG: hypothetical protein J5620_02960 [Alphaproteobacteria bacterium]|nr:hypothetical protein [Alphaproteobacteria bacterium]
MKYKFIAFILLIAPVCAFATADNTVTSKSYVDYEVGQKQNKIGGGTADTVITNTGAAGTVGAKGVYKTTTAYSSQTNSLIEANHANSAIQNGLNAHVTCYESENGECILWSINQLSGTYMPE